MKEVLAEDNLFVNEAKTEITKVERKIRKKKNENYQNKSEDWRHVTKLGSKLGDAEDVLKRKQLAAGKLKEMNNIWIRNQQVSRKTKIRLYKAIVKPVLLYNASTWGLNKSDEESLNSFHRQQLRKVLNVKYPDRMKNKEVYRITDERPISLQIIQSRWKLFGHILRLNEETPAKKSMKHYFMKSNASKFLGRHRVTLPTKLSSDIVLTINNDLSFIREYNVSKLCSANDLEVLSTIAEDRSKWR